MKKLVILLCIVILSFACVSCDLKELSDIDNEIRDALNITNPEDKIRQIHKLEMKIELLSDFERGLLVNYDRLLSEKDKVVLDFKNSLSWGDQLKKDVSYYTLSDLIDFNEIEILAFGHNRFPSAFLYVENEEYIR
jgi:hypothetical protein